jgi:hypothetical protein
VVQALRAKGRQNPTKDVGHELSILLSRQFRAFQNEDPMQAQQKALPFSVLDELAKPQVTDLDKAIVQITIGTAFFACCSCKNLKVPRREIKRTKLLCLRNIRFFKDGQLILAPSYNLELADGMVVTFEMQNNNDQKHNTVIRRRTDDATLCPVLQWAHLVNQIWTYPGTMEEHRSAHSGATDSNKYPHTRFLLPSKQHVQPLEALNLALKNTKLAPILFDQGQQWRCTLPTSLSIPSCSSADGQVMLSFVKSENKSNNFPNMLQSRCSSFDLSEQSQTLHLVWTPTTTPGNVTIAAMPR